MYLYKKKEINMYKFLKITSFILVLIGALNWGLIGFFNFDLVAAIFGEMTTATRIIYDIVGISAIVFGITAIMCYNKHKEENERY